jgi:carbon storage regulator CsrA
MLKTESNQAGGLALSRLILSRKAGESIAIGGDIMVEVVRHTGKRTVLAIVAPRLVSITRSELLGKLVEAAIAAAPPAAEPEPELLASPTAA